MLVKRRFNQDKHNWSWQKCIEAQTCASEVSKISRSSEDRHNQSWQSSRLRVDKHNRSWRQTSPSVGKHNQSCRSLQSSTFSMHKRNQSWQSSSSSKERHNQSWQQISLRPSWRLEYVPRRLNFLQETYFYNWFILQITFNKFCWLKKWRQPSKDEGRKSK